MARRSTVAKNWPKYLMQWGILAALVAFISGLVTFGRLALPESFSLTGSISKAFRLLSCGTIPDGGTLLQASAGIIIIVAIVLLSRLFCGYICPAGTIQDLLIRFRSAIRLKSIKVRNGSIADKLLRSIKYILLFCIFLLLHEGAAVALWMSVTAVCIFVTGSLAIDMFWCRYICPPGAVICSLKFPVWMIVLAATYLLATILGASLEWFYLPGAFCLLGYLLEIFNVNPKLRIFNVTKNEIPCNNCGQCVKSCPYHIDLRSFHNGKVNHVDCTLGGECVAACNSGALNIGASKPPPGKLWKAVPPALALILILLLAVLFSAW